jgi:hypothetical protein
MLRWMTRGQVKRVGADTAAAAVSDGGDGDGDGDKHESGKHGGGGEKSPNRRRKGGGSGGRDGGEESPCVVAVCRPAGGGGKGGGLALLNFRRSWAILRAEDLQAALRAAGLTGRLREQVSMFAWLGRA